MKFKRLLMCLLLGIILTGFANVYTYAAEEANIVTEDTAVQDTTDKSVDFNTVTGTATVTTTDSNSTTADVTTDTSSTEGATVTDTTDESTQQETLKEDSDKVAEADDAAATEKKEETKKKTDTKKEKKEKKEKAKYSEADLRLLSALIYCEANGESYNGKLAVGIVVMNRVRSKSYPNTVKGVIYQKYQFGPVSNGSLNKALARYDNGKLDKDCIKAAKEALSGVTTITVNGNKKDFSKYLYFSGNLKGSTLTLGNHEFK